MGKESNPIQQRMDWLMEKWELAASIPETKLVRMHAAENEKDMVSTFYTYLLGVDTGNHDVPIVFETIYHDDEQYTKALLQELETLLDIWNNAKKDDLNIQIEPVNWQPDYALYNEDNPAYLFIENMNRLAAHLQLPAGVYLVLALRVSFVSAKSFNRWLRFALENEFSPHLKILIDDTESMPLYETICREKPDEVVVIYPELDMDNAMQQVAAMGKPDDPAVLYRQAFMQLMQAIEKRKDASIPADRCIEIAVSNLEKSPFWIGQVIAVYAALANDQVGYKNFSKAIEYATEGVSAAEQSRRLVNDEYIYRKLMGQALMLRASLLAVARKWQAAVSDFTTAASYYTYTNDIVLAMEAWRMTGYCNRKYGDDNAAALALVKALEISKELPPHIIKVTTFPGVIELLMEISSQQHISRDEIEEAAENVYGRDWLKELMHWKQPRYAPMDDPSKTISTTVQE